MILILLQGRIIYFLSGVAIAYTELKQLLDQEKGLYNFISCFGLKNRSIEMLCLVKFEEPVASDYILDNTYIFLLTPLPEPSSVYAAQVTLVKVGSSAFKSKQCHCSHSLFIDKILNLKVLLHKALDVFKLIGSIENKPILKNKIFKCTMHMRLDLANMPDLFFISMCLFYSIPNDECFRISIIHTSNMDCDNEMLVMLYNLQIFVGGISHSTENRIQKRFADLEINADDSFGSSYSKSINLNTENIHLLIQNQKGLDLGVKQLISEVNDIIDKLAANQMSTLDKSYGDVFTDLVYGMKVTGQLSILDNELNRLDEQLDLTTYSFNKFLDIQITLIKGSALTTFNQKFCFLVHDHIACAQNQPDVQVTLSGLTWTYHVEEVGAELATKFSCVPSKAGISKKDGQLLLSTSSDRKHRLLSNGELLIMGSETEENNNYTPLSSANILKIGSCYYNSANNTLILISCELRSTVTVANGSVYNLEAYELKTVGLNDFPIIVNSLHLDADSLIKSIRSKQFEAFYLNSKDHQMVSKKGLSVLIQKDKELKKLKHKPLFDLIYENAPTYHYFSITSAIMAGIVLVTCCTCTYKFRDGIWKGIKYLYKCCITNGRPHEANSGNSEPAQEGLLENNPNPSAPAMGLPAITDRSQ